MAVVWAGLVQTALAQETARGTQELLKLLPPDSGVVLTVDDLRGQVHELLASKLAARFAELPAVKAWFDSEKYEQLETARDQIEGMLQAKLTDIRDRVLGDAVVFAVRIPREGNGRVDTRRASGLLVLKARDPALLKKLIDLINTIQTNNGELAGIVDHKRGETPYFVRTFPPGADRHADAYVNFPDGTFAISNSEESIQQLIDRKTHPVGTGATGRVVTAKFKDLVRRLPEKALARLFIDARFAEGLLDNTPSTASRGQAILKRYVRAHEFAGAALVLRDGHLSLVAAEVFEPGRFRAFLGSWSESGGPTATQLDRVPLSTLLIGSFQVDFPWLYRTVHRFLQERRENLFANAEAVLQGLLLGQDLPTRILPALGPRVLLLVDAPVDNETKTEASQASGGKWPFPTVIALELKSPEQTKPSAGSGNLPTVAVADALDNGLNTLLGLMTFDQRKSQGQARVVSRAVAGVTVKTLEPPVPLACAVDRTGHRLVLGSSSAAVERYLAAGTDAAAGGRFRQLQARGFADAQSFLCLDLAAVANLIVKHRDRLTETLANQQKRDRNEVTHDLEQILAFSRLFDAAYLSIRIDSNTATVFQTVGLLACPGDPHSTDRQP